MKYHSLPLYVAILHYPVYNKHGEIIATCISSYDVHDIARTARCYNVRGFYLINPMESQRNIAQRIIDHWDHGWGAFYNPTRKAALSVARVSVSLDDAMADIEEECGKPPYLAVTSSVAKRECVPYSTLRELLMKGSQPVLITFGTGWGISHEIINKAHYQVLPIRSASTFNHLSVRSAVAIILDRILGEQEAEVLP